MRTKKIIEAAYDNLDAFYTMCLSAAFISTYNCPEADEDSRKIMTFIGESFGLQEELLTEFGNCILGDMMNIGLITDYQATASTELLSENDKENIELYEIKGRVLEAIAIGEAQIYATADIRTTNQIRANMKYDYFHHPYNAKHRFWQLEHLAQNGNIDTVRQLGLMLATGIGCETNFKKAEKAFKKCILWGDKISALLLDRLHLCSQLPCANFGEIYREHRENCSFENRDVEELSKLSKLLRAFIITPKKDPLINNELANILLSEEHSFTEKAELIINFNEKNWKNILLSDESKNRIGFKVRKNE